MNELIPMSLYQWLQVSCAPHGMAASQPQAINSQQLSHPKLTARIRRCLSSGRVVSQSLRSSRWHCCSKRQTSSMLALPNNGIQEGVVVRDRPLRVCLYLLLEVQIQT